MRSSSIRPLEHFRFDHNVLEESVSSQEGSTQGLKPEALYTSTEDLLRLFDHPKLSGTFLDLGCGVGKTSILFGELYPDRKSIGIEFEEARISAGQKYCEDQNLQNVFLIKENLLTCKIPEAQIYFLYFPTGKVLDRILHELYQGQKAFHLIAIESHGDLLPRLRLENWLEEIDSVKLASERHHPEAIIFERNFNTRSSNLLPFDLSFNNTLLVIQHDNELWIGESEGMEWTCGERFELKFPPRTIYWRDVKKLMPPTELPPKYQEALSLRRSGEIQITTRAQIHKGIIRKIIIEPTFHLELSTGEKVEWSEILFIHQGSQLCYASSQAY